MGIRFAKRREQALLALAVQAAYEERRKKGSKGGIGRTALQKIVYFLNVLDVPMRYKFSIYTYGPFCSEILSDAELLEADEAIHDEANESTSSSYSPGAEIQAILADHADFLKEHGPAIEMVARGLATAAPAVLELFSTTDYVHRWLTTELGRTPKMEEVFGRVEELKPGKFGTNQKKQAYEWLKKVKLIVTPEQ